MSGSAERVPEKLGRDRLVVLALLLAIAALGLGLRVGYAVEQPSANPPDGTAYARIAENLYRHGSFDARPAGASQTVQSSSSYSPGLPLLVAAVYYLSGGVHLTLALIVLALIGSAAIPLTFVLGRRLGGPIAGLVGAAALAIYPALLEYQGLLLTEPLAATLLCAGIVVFLQASSAPTRWRWLASGALFGALAMVRPEYLALTAILPVAWLAREAFRGRIRSAWACTAISLVGTFCALAPWTIHNFVVLDRVVPVSTGGGKALFIGTNLDADGDGPKLRELLLSQRPALRQRLAQSGPVDDPSRLVLERVLNRIAAERYPGLDTDAALGRLGRETLQDEIAEEPIRFAGLLLDKAYETWTNAPRATMERLPWRALQLGIVILALVGLAILARRRRFEALVLGAVLAYMTAVGALLIASPRRELVVLPLLAALAGVALTARMNGRLTPSRGGQSTSRR